MFPAIFQTRMIKSLEYESFNTWWRGRWELVTVAYSNCFDTPHLDWGGPTHKTEIAKIGAMAAGLNEVCLLPINDLPVVFESLFEHSMLEIAYK